MSRSIARHVAAGILAMMLALAPATWATASQRVKGEVIAPAGAVRLTTANAWVTCMTASATTSWAAGRPLPCGGIPIIDACGAYGAPQGTLSYRFDVDRATWGTRFKLKAAEPLADLEIVFHGPRVKRFNNGSSLGEKSVDRGRVPRGATAADVCLVVGQGTRFTYIAG